METSLMRSLLFTIRQCGPNNIALQGRFINGNSYTWHFNPPEIHSYIIRISLDKTMFYIRKIQRMNWEVQLDAAFPTDICTEEKYFQQSLIYDIPFTCEEFIQIKELFDFDKL